MKYIYHHLGLGDHIICNGLVRKLVNNNDDFSIFVKPHNRRSVEFMFRDLPNLTIIEGDDDFVIRYKNTNNIENKNFLVGGFANIPGLSWDQVFYAQHNINFEERWKSFKVKRDNESELSLFNLLNPNDEKFVLIHNMGSDGVNRINEKVINQNLKKIYVEKHTENIFDYLMLIENAEEIHCVQSSFHVLVDSLDINNKKFFHTIKNNRGFTHKIKENWEIV